jgi:hypothetical protein
MMSRFLAPLLLCALTAMAADMPRVYIAATETVDASNAKDKAKHLDFGAAIAAALVKKKVPVAVVTDQSKSQWTIKSVSSRQEDNTGTKIAKLAFGRSDFSRSSGSRSGYRQWTLSRSLRVQRQERQLSVSSRSFYPALQ